MSRIRTSSSLGGLPPNNQLSLKRTWSAASLATEPDTDANEDNNDVSEPIFQHNMPCLGKKVSPKTTKKKRPPFMVLDSPAPSRSQSLPHEAQLESEVEEGMRHLHQTNSTDSTSPSCSTEVVDIWAFFE